MTSWEAVGTFAEVIGAIGVIASLLYVAKQVKAAQATAADTNRLTCDSIRQLTGQLFRGKIPTGSETAALQIAGYSSH